MANALDWKINNTKLVKLLKLTNINNSNAVTDATVTATLEKLDGSGNIGSSVTLNHVSSGTYSAVFPVTDPGEENAARLVFRVNEGSPSEQAEFDLRVRFVKRT